MTTWSELYGWWLTELALDVIKIHHVVIGFFAGVAVYIALSHSKRELLIGAFHNFKNNMETKLTPLYVKTQAQKFDYKTIFLLDLSKRNIASIGAIAECSNL